MWGLRVIKILCRLIHLFQIDQGTDPMEIELSSISGSNLSSPLSDNNSQPQNLSGNESMLREPHTESFNSLRNNTEESSSRSVERSSRRTLNIRPATSHSNICRHTQETDISQIHIQVNPIDLSRCTEAQSLNDNELLSQNNNACASETQSPSQSSNVSPINDNSTLNSEDTLHELSPTRSLTNINIAEQQRDLHNSLNKELTLSSQSKNKRRNSAPTSSNSSLPFQEYNKQNCDINLQPFSAKRVEKSQTDRSPVYSSSNVFENRAVIQDADVSNANEISNKLPSSTDELSTNKRYSTLSEEEVEITKNASCELNLGSLENFEKNAHGISEETRSLPSNSTTDSVNETINQDTEPCATHLLQNEGITATSRTTPTKRNDINTNILISEPMPSTSGISSRTSGYSDSSSAQNNSTVHLPKMENRKFYDHPRKRVYPSLLKKSRRPVIDSSSDSSSSEEEGVATKRLCPTSPLTPRTPTLNSAINPTLEQNSTNSNESPASLNFNHELEVLVTDLLLHNDSGTVSETVPENCQHSQTAAKNSSQSCDACRSNSSEPPITIGQCSRTTSTLTKTHTCARTTETPSTRTTPTTSPYTSSGTSRVTRSGRFFSHRVSAFYPTRIQNLRPYSRLRHNSNYLSPAMRNRLRLLNSLQNANRFSGVFALDEVINYSERTAADEVPEPSVGFHPFDPPPEYATINPENIGIGNMYSNIVQELESSLNDVRNIRASNRIGETSDMLSSFSERLESIMNQSNAILRNLRTSIETLQPNEPTVPTFENNLEQQSSSSARTHQPHVSFNDNNFYLRQQTNQSEECVNTPEETNILETNPQDDLFPGHISSSATSDHTYPLNSRNPESATNNMSPLMASLHLTVSHIQRQARLLRQQVESIERIDRAMLEVAQLQMMRQMFIEMQCYFRAARYSDNISSMLRVRQMMAGTRISDSSPYDSPNESTSENVTNSNETATHSNDTNANGHQHSTARSQPRKAYPRCIFLAQRNPRRGSVGNILQRRCLSRERIMRRNSFRRSFTYRSLLLRTPTDLTNRSIESGGLLSSDSLRSLTRRLESFLMEHGRHIGRVVEPTRASTSGTDRDEYIMMLRLNKCRARIYRLGPDSLGNSIIRRQTSSVTTDGSSRYNARDMLTMAIENLSELMNAPNITSSLRLMVWNVVDLSLLLSEILLLQIVDSIPPPSGMNLDPERESLSARIDQMCSRMLQNRLSGQSQQLTRCLRLTRLAVRHASRALNQTYTARRNSMLPTSHNRDQRRMLLEEINNCLRNIRRHGIATQMSNQRVGNNTENLSRTEWYRTIHSLITRYRCSRTTDDTQPDTPRNHNNTDSVVQTETLQPSTQASSDDDNNETYWQNNHSNNNNGDSTTESNDRMRPLYRTNNVNLFNLLNTEEQNLPSSSRNRPWNIPTVQINDIPISQYQSPWLPRFLATHRQRLPERFSEIRTYPMGSVFRPRFLHPLHGSNPFETDFDESVREQIYDSDIMTPITPNHRIQLWEFSSGAIPNINNGMSELFHFTENTITECASEYKTIYI